MTKRRYESGQAHLVGLFVLLTGSVGICSLAWGQPGFRLGLIAQVVLLLVSLAPWADRTYGGPV